MIASTVEAWSIAVITFACIIFRPRRWPEAVWASFGATAMLAFRIISPREALSAVARGSDVYLFLAGMMLLADLARQEGVFDWLAGLAVRSARGSCARLFLLTYSVGIAVTVFLSNDATAVVLTPAVFAAVKKARIDAPLPYLFGCAFVANAASFVLPISNPANLVLYGIGLPPLLPWLRVFALPSFLSIAATYAALRWRCKRELNATFQDDTGIVALSRAGYRAGIGILGTGTVLILTSALGHDLGLPTLIAALAAVLIATRADHARIRHLVRHVSWSVLPMVAGLFVLVQALNQAGASLEMASFLHRLAQLPTWAATLGASFGVTVISNLLNNLPSGLLTSGAIRLAPITPQVRDALLIGVDLGPNLSVTGSLATLLWLIALRREGASITGWNFLKVGATVMPPALLLATLALLL